MLFDGSTDAAMLVKEVSYVQYFDPTPSDSDEVKTKQEFFALSKVDHSHADGVKKSIEDALIKNGKLTLIWLQHVRYIVPRTQCSCIFRTCLNWKWNN